MLNTSLSGLLTYQRALATTSHNISNATTPGYTRQRTQLQAVAPQAFGNGFFGRGVGVETVSQITNRFVELRLRDAITDDGRSATYERLSARLDDLLASREAGLAPGLEGFFNSVQNLSADPSSGASRELMLSEADTLVGRFQFLDGELNRLSLDLNGELRSMVAEVNALATDIANINDDIVTAISQGAGQVPNDLLDQRRERINNLAELVSVRVVEQENGAVNVFVGNGEPVVIGSTAFELTTTKDSLDPSLEQVARSRGSLVTSISDQITGGKLGALIDFRREVMPLVRNELGIVATVLAGTFNAQHIKGMDADGNLGGDFFTLPTPVVFADSFNSGTATVTTSFTDVTGLEASDYRLDYDGATFTLTRLSDGTATSGPGPLLMDGLQVAVGAGAVAGDSFLLRPVARGAELFDVAITDPDRIAASGPVRSSGDLANLGDAKMAHPQVDDATNPALLSTVAVVFNDPPSTYDVVDVVSSTTLIAGASYTEGSPISVNGWTTQITGDPVAGDRFVIESNIGGVGDNRNSLALAELQTSQLIGGRSTLEQGYGGLVATVGITSRQAQFNAQANEQLRADAQQRRDELSGVNLDEEAVDLTRYQRSYQAMAQAIETSNTVFASLLAAISR